MVDPEQTIVPSRSSGTEESLPQSVETTPTESNGGSLDVSPTATPVSVSTESDRVEHEVSGSNTYAAAAADQGYKEGSAANVSSAETGSTVAGEQKSGGSGVESLTEMSSGSEKVTAKPDSPAQPIQPEPEAELIEPFLLPEIEDESDDDRNRRILSWNLRRLAANCGIRLNKLAEQARVDYGLLRRWSSRGLSKLDNRNRDELDRIAKILGLNQGLDLFSVQSPLTRIPTPRRESAVSPVARPADRVTNPAVEELRQQEPELFDGFTNDDWTEIYSLHGIGGPLTVDGVRHAVEKIHRKREIRQKFEALLETHHFRTLANVIDVFYRDVQVERPRI